MGTFLTIDGWRVMVYSRDRAPAHVHFISRDGRAKISMNFPGGSAVPVEAMGMDAGTLKRVLSKMHGLCFAAHGGAYREPSDETIACAMESGKNAAAVEARAFDARIDEARKRLLLKLAGEVELAIPVQILGFPAGDDLSGLCVEGGGFDLYFPAIDEGVFVPDLVRAAIEHRLAA